MSAPADHPNYSPGLEGIPAGISKVSEIDSDRSSLQYRGYDVHDLAERGSFEETAYLLLYEKLPNRTELQAFREEIARERDVPPYVVEVLRALPKETHPMDRIRTAFSALAPSD
ncbi:MAG: citrate synthase, partial [Armatimonadota bacterium]